MKEGDTNVKQKGKRVKRKDEKENSVGKIKEMNNGHYKRNSDNELPKTERQEN